MFCEGGVVTQSLQTTVLMCTLTSDIAKLAISINILELCYRKIFLMKDFSTSTKSQHTIKNRVSQLGMLAPLGGARNHSRGFKTAYRFLSSIKSAFIFGCSVSIFQRFYALVICNSQTSKPTTKSLSLFVVGYNQALKTKCV